MPGKDTKSAIPELGMAAAAFASLLVIATLDWPPEPPTGGALLRSGHSRSHRRRVCFSSHAPCGH